MPCSARGGVSFSVTRAILAYAWHGYARPVSPCPVRVHMSLVRARLAGPQELVASLPPSAPRAHPRAVPSTTSFDLVASGRPTHRVDPELSTVAHTSSRSSKSNRSWESKPVQATDPWKAPNQIGTPPPCACAVGGNYSQSGSRSRTQTCPFGGPKARSLIAMAPSLGRPTCTPWH